MSSSFNEHHDLSRRCNRKGNALGVAMPALLHQGDIEGSTIKLSRSVAIAAAGGVGAFDDQLDRHLASGIDATTQGPEGLEPLVVRQAVKAGVMATGIGDVEGQPKLYSSGQHSGEDSWWTAMSRLLDCQDSLMTLGSRVPKVWHRPGRREYWPLWTRVQPPREARGGMIWPTGVDSLIYMGNKSQQQS